MKWKVYYLNKNREVKNVNDDMTVILDFVDDNNNAELAVKLLHKSVLQQFIRPVTVLS